MAQWFYYYGGLADKIEGAVIPIDKPDTFNYTRYEPLGVVAAIMPWNSPLLLTAWKLAPALAAGNTVVIKPSEFTSASLLEFMKLDRARPASRRASSTSSPASAPEVGGAARRASARRQDRVHRLGRAPAQKIYEAAARGLKRVSMELGGKSPNIVFDDAELDNAVKGVDLRHLRGDRPDLHRRLAPARAAERSTTSSSRSCVAFAKTAKMGDPMSPDTQVGPVTNQPQLEKMLDYIDIAEGGRRARRCSAAARATRRSAATAGSSSRRSSPASTTRCASRRKKCSARCCR